MVNETGMTGVFNTVLTDISGNTLTSTATIDSVSLTDDGRNISCANSSDMSWQVVQVQDTPPAPNLVVTEQSTAGSEVTVNLTWNESRCAVVYNVEYNTSMGGYFTMPNIPSQYIVLPLNIGPLYSFRVRGVNSIGRLGNWSDYFAYNSSGTVPTPPSTNLPTMTVTSMMAIATASTIPATLSIVPSISTAPTITATPSAGGLSAGGIAGIVIGSCVVIMAAVVAIIITVAAISVYCRRHRDGQDIQRPPAAVAYRQD